MEKEILEQILAQQILILEEIKALKKEITTLKLQMESISKMQTSFYTMQERQMELIRKNEKITQNICDALEIKPELTTEEIRQQIELMENSIPRYKFGSSDKMQSKTKNHHTREL